MKDTNIRCCSSPTPIYFRHCSSLSEVPKAWPCYPLWYVICWSQAFHRWDSRRWRSIRCHRTHMYAQLWPFFMFVKYHLIFSLNHGLNTLKTPNRTTCFNILDIFNRFQYSVVLAPSFIAILCATAARDWIVVFCCNEMIRYTYTEITWHILTM